jgi:biopolymer transport protein ExbD
MPSTQERKNIQKYSFGRQDINIDMTPMTDLAFLLLTFFMLTTTLSKLQTMEIVMPLPAEEEDQEQAVKESKALTLVLADDDKIYWYQGITDAVADTTSFGESTLHRLLVEKNESIEDLVVLIKPMDDSNFENLVDILDEMQLSQTNRYAIVDFTEEDQKLLDESGL